MCENIQCKAYCGWKRENPLTLLQLAKAGMQTRFVKIHTKSGNVRVHVL
jgi:hypothetical protein